MSDTVKGSAHFYGLGDVEITNMQIVSITPSAAFDRNDQTFDNDGNSVEDRWGDKVLTCEVVGRIRTGFSFPALGADLTLANFTNSEFNTTFTVESASEPRQSRGYLEATLTLKRRVEVSYSE